LLGEHTFNNVYEITFNGGFNVHSDFMEKVYYSRSIGIIGFVMRENGIWVLNESLQKNENL
jgi:hypothetical protein